MGNEDEFARLVGDAAALFDFRSRTLLNSICGFSELLADPLADLTPEQRRVYAEIVFACGERLQIETAAFAHMLTPEVMT